MSQSRDNVSRVSSSAREFRVNCVDEMRRCDVVFLVKKKKIPSGKLIEKV